MSRTTTMLWLCAVHGRKTVFKKSRCVVRVQRSRGIAMN